MKPIASSVWGVAWEASKVNAKMADPVREIRFEVIVEFYAARKAVKILARALIAGKVDA